MLTASMLSYLLSDQANGWSALIAFFGMVSAIGVIVGPYIANRQAREVKKNLAVAEVKAEVREAKLDQVHVLVNGNLDAEKRKNVALRQKLMDNGIDPD